MIRIDGVGKDTLNVYKKQQCFGDDSGVREHGQMDRLLTDILCYEMLQPKQSCRRIYSQCYTIITYCIV